MRWGWSDLPGMYALPCVLAMPIDPGGTCASLPDGYTLLPATLKIVSASTCSTYEADTGFTLSHYGSRTSLPTLKPDLAAKAPRLCTDCLPSFVRAGVSPTYTAYTELAHPHRCPILPAGKAISLYHRTSGFCTCTVTAQKSTPRKKSCHMRECV